ncbi:MurR/RpiR family transcriptional regulator [Caminicella sporogenes]|uniref:MurR/RpiR family transcriptional regulator n=1 Tax=Caminicella sporogenes TaxID=166485 RepID=UPI0025412988|nr:MurR/RpiR family transcriptional regulator [Caminicella sporogenes]WIF93957.1 MurR/RpiR family transcriptional regulator [Caminicella sporogenes]
MSVLKVIRNNLPNLSNKQKNIAKYLIKNKNKIPFMSLKELSSELNVSEVTILNFCKAIKIDSFIDLKKSFEHLIKEELKVPAKMKSSLDELESIEDAINNTFQIQKMNLNKIIENNSIESIEKATNLILNANTVFICGLGVSKLICDFLHTRFKILNINTKILDIDDSAIFIYDLIRASKDDLFILISFPLYSEKIIKLAEYLSIHNLNFISITNSEKSPIASNAQIVLKSENNSLVFYNFISAAILLSEILLIVLSYKMKDKITFNINTIENLHDFFNSKRIKNKINKKSNSKNKL